MTVYITKYNFGRLLASPQHKLEMDGHDGALYSECCIDWFNNLEAARLYFCKILLLEHSHPLFDRIIGQRWLYVATPQDNYTRAARPQQPRYHRAGCACVKSDFVDLVLPVGFKETYGIQGVERFRDWFAVHRELLPDHEQRFLTKVQALWPRVQWESAVREAVRRRNSGTHPFYHFNLAELAQTIQTLLAKYQVWQDTLPFAEQQALRAHKRRCRQRGLRADHVAPQRLTDLLDEFARTFKNPMRDALLLYYYQSAQKSGVGGCDAGVLEELGFIPCGKCHPEPTPLDADLPYLPAWRPEPH
ncbi:hypothetical protein [Conchiformibius kuhniae]|uniref:Uncharacterized protein n=1 Tax=Conchiformibius kuhniae TaxID=211502 RepID=A0A8T9MTI5_9NEIS|nr:hypothetical protein [Conchiformibius kuhniae]